MRIVYSESYNADIGLHVFPTRKYRLVKDRLVSEGAVQPGSVLEPEPPSDADLLLTHEPGYLERLNSNSLTQAEVCVMEIPFSQTIYRSFRLMVGGTLLASQVALEDGLGVHIGGGFHHAFADHGEGFCILNDVAVAVARLIADKRIERALVVDCDLHQGNGTAAIFRARNDVFTFSIHQENNYPFVKQRSDMDIGLRDGADGEEYCGLLLRSLPPIFESFRPQFLMYLAGADPYEEDQLGMLSLTKADLEERDRIVMQMAHDARVPFCVVLAGGYAWKVEDTVDIHFRTILTAKQVFGRS